MVWTKKHKAPFERIYEEPQNGKAIPAHAKRVLFHCFYTLTQVCPVDHNTYHIITYLSLDRLSRNKKDSKKTRPPNELYLPSTFRGLRSKYSSKAWYSGFVAGKHGNTWEMLNVIISTEHLIKKEVGRTLADQIRTKQSNVSIGKLTLCEKNKTIY